MRSTWSSSRHARSCRHTHSPVLLTHTPCHPRSSTCPTSRTQAAAACLAAAAAAFCVTVPACQCQEQRGTVLASVAARCECVLSATCPPAGRCRSLGHSTGGPGSCCSWSRAPCTGLGGRAKHTHPRTGRPTSMPCGASRQPKKCPECMADNTQRSPAAVCTSFYQLESCTSWACPECAAGTRRLPVRHGPRYVRHGPRTHVWLGTACTHEA